MDGSGNTVAMAQCYQYNDLANAAPYQATPITNLYFYSGVNVSWEMPLGWWTDDYTAAEHLILRQSRE